MKYANKIERPKCLNCGKPMRQKRDPIARRYTGYLWKCKCSKAVIMSIG